MHALRVTKGHMGEYIKLGAGAKPQPGPPCQLLNNSNLNLYKTTYITRHIIWHVGSADFAKAMHGGEVWGSIPTDSITFKPTTNNRVPHGSPRLGHVAPNHWTEYATCQ
jgi:hypothetical protein